MRISAKGRYAMAAMVHLGQHGSEACIPVIHISDKLNISKIYLEQVFSLLKRGGLVSSLKGSQGGYQLTRKPEEITACEILKAIEVAVFEATKETVNEMAPEIEKAMQSKVYGPLDDAIEQMLMAVTLQDLVDEAKQQLTDDGYMFFI